MSACVQQRHVHVQHDSTKRAMNSHEAAYNSYREAVTALRKIVDQRKILLKYAPGSGPYVANSSIALHTRSKL